jgi:hypothetical protein
VTAKLCEMATTSGNGRFVKSPRRLIRKSGGSRPVCRRISIGGMLKDVLL